MAEVAAGVGPDALHAQLRVAMVAGEASGDLLAALLLQGARAHWSQLHGVGIGGPQMQAEGFEAWWPSERLAVHGYSLEVFKRVAGLLRIRRQLGTRLLAQRPDVFIGVDAPDFNLGLERRLRAGGIPTVHFVCPSIWAWRPERVHAIRAAADHVLCLFPFEPALLAEHGIAATFVGHPLANAIADDVSMGQARTALGLAHDAPVLALLPGSRSKEIDYLLPRFLAAAAQLRRQWPNLQLVLPAVAAQAERIARLIQVQPLQPPVRILAGQSHQALAACDVTLIASGTATLEAALFKKPMVISYAMHPLSAWLMRRKQLQPWVGLPNILLREQIVPELLQDAATPEALAAEVDRWLHAATERDARWQTLRCRFGDLHRSLRADTAQAAAQAIGQVLGR
ncbi:lipid-A-disaccharide synthase [Lampropedia cohaerens]|uniref:Lipid-A-disaccharide synthase n=1 Tax=Lampropedia cohaerens TaxID=1610491 RepID=A0A0U1PWF0_9BURK|nr:lipid-A-disaccharide synthase [Lampropedia cohaerens]KKW66863.1 lipid-A-disaccharide synthase [Lampropedia cohaerens]